jgi:hypothetical protein
MNKNKLSPFSFRCEHRHNGITHPKCYFRYLNSGTESGNTKLPKVLILDIETSPLKAYIWQTRVWHTNVSEQQVLSQWFMLSWSAKWLFDVNVMSESLTGKEAKNEDDSRIISDLWKLLDDADIVIAHNGDSFDVPNMNTRFIVNNLPPTSPYQTIDTVKVARKQFGFTHNNLNALAKVFGFDVKLETSFHLWKECIEGNEEALRKMERYNRHDVELLEEVYVKIRPWIRSHPNLGLYVQSTEPVCPNCGNSTLDKTGKFYYTQTGKYETFRCKKCGAFGRMRTTATPKDVRKNLIVSIAK